MARESTSAERFRVATEVFNRVRRAAAADRSQLLAEACGDDEALRAEVRALLAEHTAMTAHEDSAPRDRPPTLSRLIDASIGVRRTASRVPEAIGGFRIIERIGVGGMGHVYEAEQEHPKRLVAILREPPPPGARRGPRGAGPRRCVGPRSAPRP